MKKRFSLICRGHRGGIFYCYDSETRKRESLGTKDHDEAQRLIDARNDSLRVPALNLNIARAYLAGADPLFASRTWQQVMDAAIAVKSGSTKIRWQRAAKDKAFDSIRNQVVTSTTPEQFFQALHAGTISTNTYLRRFHHYALGMGWLPWPIIPARKWPPLRYGAKRAITAEEHRKILTIVKLPERRVFYELCWHVGGAQGDLAALTTENIDWNERIITFNRQKTGTPVLFHFGDEVAQLLKELPRQGLLFPGLFKRGSAHRAADFKRECTRAGVSGVTLHSYRYAWAERAKTCGYPERFAQQALGHSSKAVHRAYARKAEVKIPALEDFEKEFAEKKIIPLPPTAKAVNQ